MRSFLQDIADVVKRDYPDWEHLQIVFPNRRAALYFKQELARGLPSPRWSPSILTIEELINTYTTLQEVDKLTSILTLYQAFKKVTGSTEKIDQFFYWGEMLLRDFDELDKYMVDAEFLFRDISNLKEVDQYFDYLTEEQKVFLKDFWQSVEFSTEETRNRFLSLWKNLYPVYKEFRESLLQNGTAYAGLIHRLVAEQLTAQIPTANEKITLFAGFNALTTAEEKVMCWFVKNQNASVFWDEDEFYVSSEHREAGAFFRLYRKHSVLGKTFTERPASHLSSRKQINIYGVPQKAGQSKLLAQQLVDQKALDVEESHVIVLPDESLLMPLLYSLPSSISSINVTMGFPLMSTPYFSLIDFLFDLHRTKRKDEFYFKGVMAVLNHPYLNAVTGVEVAELKKFIADHNQVHLDEHVFESNGTFIASIFRMVNETDFIPYLLEVITLFATAPFNGMLDKEFAFYFHRILTKLQELAADEPMELAMLQKLFRQITRSEKIPFSGEPLKGIQIMGVLETRNLDFDHVHVLSLNEGLWPAAPRQGSYLPHSIRKAYGLPTYTHQDAMYGYLFYRLLQRSEQVNLYYNTEPDVLGSGEMSRYLYQIMYETQWPYTRKILYGSIKLSQPSAITIQKDLSVMEKLQRYVTKELTPSTLNVYLECRLKFYFNNLIGLKEEKEVEEEADARIFGNLFHDVMHFFYSDVKSKDQKGEIRAEHFSDLPKKLDLLVERAYRKHFNLNSNKKVEYQGQQLVVNEMVKKMADHVLGKDQEYAPFFIDMLEQEDFKTSFSLDTKLTILLGGKIDRVDRKENVVRIIDYKTGKDENSFDSITSLFDRDSVKRNKAAFQALFYSWVYDRANGDSSLKLQPGLINRKEIFKDQFEYGLSMKGEFIQDVKYLLPEFENNLVQLLTELFDSKQPFDQTTKAKTCEYCAYKEICGR
ncbi:MAG: PD-(D/E)XK nuclease family protein [Cyclobacteriaceae bacterium]|nr:PD-(D/E)XK nuclease family protein [Cyclobacteriaceae bacterium]